MAPSDYRPRRIAPAPYVRAPPSHPAQQMNPANQMNINHDVQPQVRAPYPAHQMNINYGVQPQVGAPYPIQHMNINYGVQQQFRAPYPVQQMNRGYGIQQPMVAPHVQHFPMQHMNGGQGMYNAGGAPPQQMPLVNAYDIQYQQQHMVAAPAQPQLVARQEVIEIPDDEDEVQFVSAAPRTTPQSPPAAEPTRDWTARLPPAPGAQNQPESAGKFSMRKYIALKVPRVFGGKNAHRGELSQEDQELLALGQQMAKEATQKSKARRAEAEKREEERKKTEAEAEAQRRAEAEAKRKAESAQQAKEKAQQEQRMRLQLEKAAEEERRKKMAAARPVMNRGGLFLPNMRTQATTGAATTKRTRLDDQETGLAGPASQPPACPLLAKAAGKRKATDEPEADSPATKRGRFEPAEAAALDDRRDSGYASFLNSPNQVETSAGPDEMEAGLWAALNEDAAGSEDDGGAEVQHDADADVEWDKLFGSAGEIEQHDAVATNDDEELFGPSGHEEQSGMTEGANASPQASATQVSEAPLEGTAHAKEPTPPAVHDETVKETREAGSDSESEYDSEEEDDEETAAAKLQYRNEIAALEAEIEDRNKSNIMCTNNILRQRNLSKIADNEAKIVLKKAALAELSKAGPEDVAEEDVAEESEEE